MESKKPQKVAKYSKIMDVAKDYLTVNGTMNRYKYLKIAEKKLAINKFKIFLKWTSQVEQFESNVKRQQSNEWYLKLLEKSL